MADILIIDSYACVRDLLKEELTLAGYTVHPSADTSSIQELVSTSWPDLVILDIYHEGTKRWDLLFEIKEQAPNLPVVIFTAYDGYRSDPRSSLADGFVIKSVFLDGLISRLNEILKRRRVSTGDSEGELRPARRSPLIPSRSVSQDANAEPSVVVPAVDPFRG